MIYLDYQATTPTDPSILAYFTKCQKTFFANPSSNHSEGLRAKKGLEEARRKIKHFLGIESDSVFFTPSATIAINIILKSLITKAPKEKRHIIALKTEHKAVLETLKELELHDFEVTLLDVKKNGLADISNLKKSINSKTLMVIVSHANNEIGVVQPIEKIGRICKQKKALFLIDGAQAFGKIKIPAKRNLFDFYIASSHKLYGPKGIAFFSASTDGKKYLLPFICGGGQEQNIISGTENVPAIMAFAAAAELSISTMEEESNRILLLRTLFLSNIKQHTKGISVNGDLKNRLPGNINITIEGVSNNLLIEQINDTFMISAASACTTATQKTSHVLEALNLSPENINSTVRISIGRYTTKKDVIALEKTLSEKILYIRKNLFSK